MEILIYFFIFLFGLAVGSFLNCVIYRLETGGNFFRGRSFCPKCKHILSWPDLIPLFSFFLLKGKCRYCQQKISLQYPLVELATGILFVLTAYNLQLTIYNLKDLFVVSYLLLVVNCLLVIFVYDLKHYIIPDKIIYPAIAVAFLYQIISNFQWVAGGWRLISITNFQFLITNFYHPFLSAVGAALFFLFIVLISRGKWMGVGDIKLAFLMGLVLGFPNILVALFSAFLLGAIIGIGLIISGKKTLKSEVPFGPFLVTGTFIALFWGQEIINWYAKSLYIN